MTPPPDFNAEPNGFHTQPATNDEARAAFEKGRAAGADFAILVRETEEDGGIDEQTHLVYSPPGSDLRPVFVELAERGLAIRCSPPTREERRQHETKMQAQHGQGGKVQ